MELNDDFPGKLPLRPSISGPGLGSTTNQDGGFPGWGPFRREGDRVRLVPLRIIGLPLRESPGLSRTEEATNPSFRGKDNNGRLLTPPGWLEGHYRPRALTPAGTLALEQLGPMGEGFTAFPKGRFESLSDRRDHLAGKYAALDLLKRGLVCEVNGTFHHISHKHSLEELGEKAKQSMNPSDKFMEVKEILEWLAVGRSMTLDQYISLDPDNASKNVDLLWALENEKLVDRFHVKHGRGSWEAYTLSKSAWRYLRHDLVGLDERGFGPRRPIGCNRDFHELIQVDAIFWFEQMIKDAGGQVVDLKLEKALKGEIGFNEKGSYFDFRMNYINEDKMRGLIEVEVIGMSSWYRMSIKRNAIKSSPVYWSFSAHSDSIEMEKHVVIGR